MRGTTYGATGQSARFLRPKPPHDACHLDGRPGGLDAPVVPGVKASLPGLLHVLE